MSWGAPDPMFDDWQQLDWRDRRERRFQRWLSARGVEFVDDSARESYMARVQGMIDAIQLKKPQRVPVSANVHFYSAKYAGFSKKEAMYDYQKMAESLRRYHEDFQPDFQAKPVSPAKVFELLDLKFIEWPGQNLPDEMPWQYLEGEYMKPDEYDALLADPEGYFRRSLLPRFGTAFAPLAGHAALHRLRRGSRHAVQPPGFCQPRPDRRYGQAGRGCGGVFRVDGSHQGRGKGRLRTSGHTA